MLRGGGQSIHGDFSSVDGIGYDPAESAPAVVISIPGEASTSMFHRRGRAHCAP